MTWLNANGPLDQHPNSYYTAITPPLDPLPPLRGQQTADLCVIGAGITGLSAALHAAQSGLTVIVLEAARVGWGASGRNGGQVGSGYNWDQRRLETTLGRDTARALWTLAEEGKAFTRSHAPDYAPGILYTTHSDTELSDHAKWMQDHYAQPLEVLTRDQITARTGTRAYAAGTLDPTGGTINPLAYTFALARACLAEGVTIHEATRVHRIKSPLVAADRGRVTARHIFHATNGLSPHLTRATGTRVLPINNYIAVTEPLGDRAPMVQPVAVADDKYVVNYFRQTPDGRLIYGGGESYGKRYPTDIAGKVRKNLAQIYPDLRDVTFSHAWGGTLAVTATRLPYIGQPAPGVIAAGGYSGHGLALSARAGQAAAQAVQGDMAALDTLSKLKTPALPGGRILGGWMTTAGMAFAALRDRLAG